MSPSPGSSADLGAADRAHSTSTTAHRPARTARRNERHDNRNMILAIVLSIVVLFGWQFFVAGPQMERAQREAQIAAQQQAASSTGPTSAIAGAERRRHDHRHGAGAARAPSTFATREQRSRRTRASPSTPQSLTGSINLTGGRLDDLRLKKYHETVDTTSPIITPADPGGRARRLLRRAGLGHRRAAARRCPTPMPSGRSRAPTRR